MLTQENLKEILYYDPISGIFVWLKPNNGYNCRIKPGDIAGGLHKYYKKCRTSYIRIRINRKFYLAHRLAFLYMTGNIPKYIDHKDNNGLNNKWENLRKASKRDNSANVLIQENNTSGYKGVTFDKSRNKWLAGIKYNYKRINLGRYDTAKEAAMAYDKKALELFGEFACTNFSKENFSNV